jgi:transcriptional regulator with XRE-family HTH domain
VDLGRRLKESRKRADLSQEALARRADVSTVAVAQIEQGRTKEPHYLTLHRLSKVLGVSPHWLYTGEKLEEPVLLGKAEAPAGTGPPEDASELASDLAALLLVDYCRTAPPGDSPAAHAVRPVLEEQGAWSRALGERIRTADERIRTADDPFVTMVNEESERLERGFDRAEAALPELRKELLAKLRFPADGPAPEPGTREAVKRVLRGHPAGEKQAESTVRKVIDKFRMYLVAAYQRKGRTLAYLRTQLLEQIEVTEEVFDKLLAEAAGVKA